MPKSPCNIERDALYALVEGDLEGEVLAEMKRHVESCPGCLIIVLDALASRNEMKSLTRRKLHTKDSERIARWLRHVESKLSQTLQHREQGDSSPNRPC